MPPVSVPEMSPIPEEKRPESFQKEINVILRANDFLQYEGVHQCSSKDHHLMVIPFHAFGPASLSWQGQTYEVSREETIRGDGA